MLSEKDIKRFWSHVEIGNLDECWPWKLSLFPGGYGCFSLGGRCVRSHVVAHMVSIGPVGGLKVRHNCDNPICCNPAHLILGTQKQNMEDMISRGRSSKNRGTTNPSAKIDQITAQQIRAEYKSGSTSQMKLGKKYNISASGVGRIIRNEIWVVGIRAGLVSKAGDI